jgi:archaellum component FlaC
MEAATPLRTASVRTLGEDRLVVDGLVVADECAVRLVREREEAGDDPVKAVADAIEIGARVLDREQAGANADFVKSEFDKVSREVEAAFTERAKEVSARLEGQMEAVFGPESGHLTRALERHFSDDSSAAVQNRVKDVITEVMQRSREDLLRQFSSADGQNPLADFKDGTLRQLRHAGEQQEKHLSTLNEQLTALKVELQALRSEKEKADELADEREKGSAKGRTFEEAVAEALERIAAVRDDACDAVGDVTGSTGKVGDVVVELDACNGPARGRIVFEAKSGKPLTKPKAWQQLNAALAQRDADFAVLVVPSEDRLPAKTRPLTEYNGDKLLVAFDPEGDSTLPLEVAYSLARARVLMARADDDVVDSGAIRDVVERALAVVDDARKIKSQLTGSKKGIEAAYEMLDEMENRVREYLRDIEGLAAGADSSDAASDDPAERAGDTAADDGGDDPVPPAPAVIPGQEQLV